MIVKKRDPLFRRVLVLRMDSHCKVWSPNEQNHTLWYAFWRSFVVEEVDYSFKSRNSVLTPGFQEGNEVFLPQESVFARTSVDRTTLFGAWSNIPHIFHRPTAEAMRVVWPGRVRYVHNRPSHRLRRNFLFRLCRIVGDSPLVAGRPALVQRISLLRIHQNHLRFKIDLMN